MKWQHKLRHLVLIVGITVTASASSAPVEITYTETMSVHRDCVKKAPVIEHSPSSAFVDACMGVEYLSKFREMLDMCEQRLPRRKDGSIEEFRKYADALQACMEAVAAGQQAERARSKKR